MSAEEDERVAALHARKFSAGRIATAMNRHRCTINWALYRLGLRVPRPAAGGSYKRNGVTVSRFTPDEDLYIETLRVAGHPTTKIAKACSARFSTSRSPHTIAMRLRMLANRED